LEELCGYLEVNYGITYQSKQSYYDLLDAGGMSHREAKSPQERDVGAGTPDSD
jgi:hypothetical protein